MTCEKSTTQTAQPLTIGETTVPRGERRRLQLPASRLPTQTQLYLPIEVVHGRRPGPRLWLSAAIHGDELNGLEIIKRVLARIEPRQLNGALIAAPIVNVFGFIQQERYLPDRRDLNRSFPGSPRGSLAAQLANLFMTEIVEHCTHGIDLHTASNHRDNLPQVRANLQDAETRRIAEAFAAPIMIHGEAPDGSLRGAVAERGIPIIVYEAGEPQRFNPEAINMGVKGVLRVMADLGMRRGSRSKRRLQSQEAQRSTWVRAERGGIFHRQVKLGHWVTEGDTLGTVEDAFGEEYAEATSTASGIVIGATNNPLVHQGDAIVHIATDVVS